MHSRLAVFGLASMVWLINPAFVIGCGGVNEAEFTFGEAERSLCDRVHVVGKLGSA